jgi:hypothetical protein
MGMAERTTREMGARVAECKVVRAAILFKKKAEVMDLVRGLKE